MNRGFKHYFREGMSASASTLFGSKGKNHIRFLLYFFAELLGRITLILTPLFDFAKVRQGRVLRTEKRYEPAQSFRRAGEPRPFWTLVLCYLLELLIILGGLLLIGVFTAMLAGLGYGISYLVRDVEALALYFAIPGGILAIVFLVAALLIFAPTPYIISANENIGVGDTLAVCYNTMKANGMGTLFLNVFLTTLMKLVYLGIFFGIDYLLFGMLDGERYLYLVLVIVNSIGLIGYMVGAPVLTLGRRAASQHLFEDILVDPVAVSKASKGIRISQCRGQKFGDNDKARAIVAMFDDTEGEVLTDDITLEPKRKKRSRKAPAAEDIYAPRAYAEQPAEPVYAEPVAEQPVPEAPVYEQPAEQPVYEQPVYEQPAQEPVYEEPAQQQPAEPAEQPAYEQPVREPVYEEPAVEQPEPVAEQPVPEEPVYEQPAEQPVQEPDGLPEQPAETVAEESAAAEQGGQPAEGTSGTTGGAVKPKPVLRRRRLK